ncbi:MAG: AGE family epimerase/isomerase, partial [Bacteroidota bacterium]
MPRPFFLVALVLASVSAYAQPVLQSEHLADPDRLIDVLRANATFWIGDAWDQTNGGFYTNIDREGDVNFGWGSNKDVLTQSRNAFAFVRAFQLTGDEAFLDAARVALDFQYAHGWDETHGGWFEKLSSTGSPLNASNDKTAFIQHYGVLGPLAMWEATGNETDRQRVLDALAWNDTHLWDGRDDLEGYYDRVRRDGSNGRDKGFNATVDALTTHAFAAIKLNIKQKAKYVLDADICKCFDRINHEALLRKVNTFPAMRRQIAAWLKAGVIDGKCHIATEEGT